MKKRVLPVLLALAMVLSLLPLSAFAAPDDTIFDQPNAVITGIFNNRVVIKAASATVRDASLKAGLHIDASVDGITVTITGQTTVTQVTVTTPNAKVVIDKDVKAEAVNVEGEGADVEVRGEVETVTVAETASAASVTVAEEAVVSKVETSAPNSNVDIKSDVKAVSASEKAEGASIKTSETAKVDSIAVDAKNTKVEANGTVGSIAASEKAEGVDIKTGAASKVDSVAVDAKNASVEANGTVGAITASDKAEGLSVKATETAKVDKVDVKTDAKVDVAAGATVGAVTAPEDVKVDVSGEGAGNVTVETPTDPEPAESSGTTVPVDPGTGGTVEVGESPTRYSIVVPVSKEVTKEDGTKETVTEYKTVGTRVVYNGVVTDTLYAYDDTEGAENPLWPGEWTPAKIGALMQISGENEVVAYETLKAAFAAVPDVVSEAQQAASEANTGTDAVIVDRAKVPAVSAEIKVWKGLETVADDGTVTAPEPNANGEYIRISGNKNITLNLNGHTISERFGVIGAAGTTGTKRLDDNDVCLTITDNAAGKGTIQTTGGKNAVEVNDGGKVILQNGNIEAGNLKTTGNEAQTTANGGYGVSLFNGAEFVMNGGKITASWFAVCSQGQTNTGNANYGDGSKITINRGTLTSTADVAIYAPAKNGVVTIYGGTISGDWAALMARDGKIDLKGGTFINLSTTNNTDSNWSVKGDGSEQLAGNPAIAIIPSYVTRHNSGKMNVIISTSVKYAEGGLVVSATTKDGYKMDVTTKEELLNLINLSGLSQDAVVTIVDPKYFVKALENIENQAAGVALMAAYDETQAKAYELGQGEYMQIDTDVAYMLLKNMELQMMDYYKDAIADGEQLTSADKVFNADDVRLYWTKDGEGKDFIVLVGTTIDTTGEWSLPGQSVLVTVEVPENYTGSEKLDAYVTVDAVAPVIDAETAINGIDQEIIDKALEETKQKNESTEAPAESGSAENPAASDKTETPAASDKTETPAASDKTETPATSDKTETPATGSTETPATGNTETEAPAETPVETPTEAPAESFEGEVIASDTIHIVVNTGTGTAEAAD